MLEREKEASGNVRIIWDSEVKGFGARPQLAVATLVLDGCDLLPQPGECSTFWATYLQVAVWPQQREEQLSRTPWEPFGSLGRPH